MPPQYPPMFGGGMPLRPGMPGMPPPFPGHHPMGMGGPGGPPMMPHQQPPPMMGMGMGMGMGFPGPFGQQHQHQPGMPPLPFPPAGMPFPYGAPPGSLPHMPGMMMGMMMGTYTFPHPTPPPPTPLLRHNTIYPATTTTRPPARPTSSLFLSRARVCPRCRSAPPMCAMLSVTHTTKFCIGTRAQR